MSSLVQPARVLVDPVDGMPAAVEEKRWFWPLLFLVVTAVFAGAAMASRVDTASATIAQLELSGQLKGMSEMDIAEKIKLAENMALVVGIAKGLFVMPLLVLLLGAALKFIGWLFGTPAPFMKTFSTASLGLLPLAVFNVIVGGCALAQHSIEPRRVATLVPTNLAVLFDQVGPKLQRFLTGIDFFNLWTVGLLALGFAAASGMRRGRSFLLFAVLYLLFVGVVMVALPGMGGGPGGPGGPR